MFIFRNSQRLQCKLVHACESLINLNMNKVFPIKRP